MGRSLGERGKVEVRLGKEGEVGRRLRKGEYKRGDWEKREIAGEDWK